jgi:pimeloyl-ACP methyl ester carboxylesterase
MSTFVLVHGGWNGGWCWEKVVPLLEEAGHEAEAPDLPGSGDDPTPIPEVSLQGYADWISGVLDAQSEPVVLVGHSSGGVVISQAAEQRPDKVKLLVYLAAFLLRDGETLFSVAENETGSLILPNLVMSEDGASATIREDVIKEALFHDCSDEDAERAKSRFAPRPWPRSSPRSPSPKRTSAGYPGCTSRPSKTGPSVHRFRRRCTKGYPAKRSSPWTRVTRLSSRPPRTWPDIWSSLQGANTRRKEK